MSSSRGERSLTGDDAYETRSVCDNVDAVTGEDQDVEEDQRPRKKYHRHTSNQIQELEKFFKDCPHPDENERLELGNRLGLESRQIKFWFQNRRTQIKAQMERQDNVLLRQENLELQTENDALRGALTSPICISCGGQAVPGEVAYLQLRIKNENDRLRDEMASICALANRFLVGRNGAAVALLSLELGLTEGSLMGNEMIDNRTMLMDLGLAAMDELMKMARPDNPLWITTLDGRKEILNHDKYQSIFAAVSGMKYYTLVAEASRETAMTIIDSSVLVETLMDANRWAAMFPSIVSNAITVDVISSGTGGTRDGALLVMEAEFQMLSPLVRTRRAKFLRFCKLHPDHVWAVVDVSFGIDHQDPYSTNFKRLPSGCLIQYAANGFSQVTWVEHSMYDEAVIHRYYKQMVRSGLGFGAERWIGSLHRSSDIFTTISSTTNPAESPAGLTPAAAKGILALANRMTASYYAGISATSLRRWDKLLVNCVEADTRILTRKNFSDHGEPHGVILSAATSVWMPVSKQVLFDFLRDGSFRSHWDILSDGGLTQEMIQIEKGLDKGNLVSLLRGNVIDCTESRMTILQETWSDASGAVIIYAPVDISAIQAVMNGGDSAYIPLLPSGFAILPDGFDENYTNLTNFGMNLVNPEAGTSSSSGYRGGCFMTVGFQILVNSEPTAKLSIESVETVNNLISCTVQKIKAIFQ